jgi:CBS domain-containing protein
MTRRLAEAPGLSAVAALADLAELVHSGEVVPPMARVSDAAWRIHAAGSDVVLVADRSALSGIVTATDLIRFLVGGTSPERGRVDPPGTPDA